MCEGRRFITERSIMGKEKPAMLSVMGLGLGMGIYWGLVMVIIGWTSMFGWGGSCVKMMGSLYMGYNGSFIGGIIGGIWGFVNGLIGGSVIAFFYNRFRK